MARTDDFDMDALLADYLGEKVSFTMLGRSWEMASDVPLYVEQMWSRVLGSPGPEDESEEDRDTRTAAEHAEIINTVYGEGSYDDFVRLGGGKWRRIALVRAALAHVRGMDPEQAVRNLMEVLNATPEAQRDEVAEKAHEDAEGNVEGPDA